MNSSAEKNHRLLIVDDNRSIHDDFRKILRPEEMSFRQFENAKASLFGEETVAFDAIRSRRSAAIGQ